MNVRTISQLEDLPSGSLDNNVCYMESSMSLTPQLTQFSSRKIAFSDMRDKISSDTDAAMAVKYQLSADNGPIDVKQIRIDVDTLSAGNTTLYGVKTFNDSPSLPANVSIDDVGSTTAATIDMVQQVVDKRGVFMSGSSFVNGNPLNNVDDDDGNFNGSVYDETKFHYWKIEHNQYGSNEVTTDKTGNLVIYGWLADNGLVSAQEAWVMLMTRLNVGGVNGKQWVPVQVQPWIRGDKANTLQYVSFNVPTSKDMTYKIMTGFRVNGNNSGLNYGRCLMFTSETSERYGSTSNMFIGYVIQNSPGA